MKENTISSTPGKGSLLSPFSETEKEGSKKIISASRRTDLPAFHSRWFMEKIKEGLCRYKNPFGAQIFEVRLLPETCLGIVFWTRYPTPMFKYINQLQKMGYKFYFQFTITGYPKIFETHNPKLIKAIDSFKKLSDLISPELVFWRYDPLILSSITDRDYHLSNFESLCKYLEGYTHRCYFSFADYYSKTRQNFMKLVHNDHVSFFMPTLEEQIYLSRDLCDIGKSYNINLYACCSDELVCSGIFKARCVDDEVFKQMGYIPFPKLKPKPTRKGCGCIESTDIGTYDTCRFGCRYCYAAKYRL
jgi:hypothetical protein